MIKGIEANLEYHSPTPKSSDSYERILTELSLYGRFNRQYRNPSLFLSWSENYNPYPFKNSRYGNQGCQIQRAVQRVP